MTDLQDSPSIQSPDDLPTAPAMTGGVHRISNLFRLSLFGKSKKTDEGYIEFGQNGDLDPSAGRPLGTFAGVFSPVALSMFSALLFLRVGFIVGNAGLLVTLLQFFIAYGILFFTVTSICAICTNGAVEGGGAYFMISRTLGPDFGGSIGTLFFLANIVSSALYITGCAEGLVDNFGPSGYLEWEGHTLADSPWWRFVYCSVLNVINLIVCLIGASMFAKTSVVVFAIVFVCLLSVIISFLTVKHLEIPLPEANNLFPNSSLVNLSYTGLNLATLESNLYSNYSKDYTSYGQQTDFASVFAVLFSGVTGIMAGANMSGELKDPGRSIPRGTMGAVLFTCICYVVVSVFTAATCSRLLLANNFIYMMPINLEPAFITVGILTATFSASLSNLIGSSRVLEALAKDNIYGSLLHWVTMGVCNNNPVAAVVASWALVQLILLIGSLNTIAQINSVLFLLSYLATNFACLGLDLTSAPNFRPSFKLFSWQTALVGLIGTLVMMFVINPAYAVVSIVLCILLVILLHLFSPSSRTADWGSLSQALIFHQVRKYLLMLDSRKEHVKFWRPQILLLVHNPRTCCPLIQFVNDMKKSGLYVLGHVIRSDKEFGQLPSDPVLDQYPHWLSLIDHLKVKAFVELTVAKSVREGLHHLTHLSGLGAMKPNTIVLGFFDSTPPLDFFTTGEYLTHKFDAVEGPVIFPVRNPSTERTDPVEYVETICDILRMQKNLCICRNFQTLNKLRIHKTSLYKYIDVWPVNMFDPSAEDPYDTISQFMLQLACVINMVAGWRQLKLRVHLCEGQAPVSDMTEFSSRQVTYICFKNLLDKLRIKATINTVQDWTRLKASLRGSKVLDDSLDFSETASTYLDNVNQMMREKCVEAAVSFVYLAKPPGDGALHTKYLTGLTRLTNGLGPTVLVHGVSTVTSTNL